MVERVKKQALSSAFASVHTEAVFQLINFGDEHERETDSLNLALMMLTSPTEDRNPYIIRSVFSAHFLRQPKSLALSANPSNYCIRFEEKLLDYCSIKLCDDDDEIGDFSPTPQNRGGDHTARRPDRVCRFFLMTIVWSFIRPSSLDFLIDNQKSFKRWLALIRKNRERTTCQLHTL